MWYGKKLITVCFTISNQQSIGLAFNVTMDKNTVEFVVFLVLIIGWIPITIGVCGIAWFLIKKFREFFCKPNDARELQELRTQNEFVRHFQAIDQQRHVVVFFSEYQTQPAVLDPIEA